MTQQTQFHVQAMKCNGCIANAKSALAKLPGYENAEFDLQAQTAVVYGDVDPQSVCQALGEAGYPAVVKSA